MEFWAYNSSLSKWMFSNFTSLQTNSWCLTYYWVSPAMYNIFHVVQDSRSCGPVNAGCQQLCSLGRCGCIPGYQLDSGGITCNKKSCGRPNYVSYCPAGKVCHLPIFTCCKFPRMGSSEACCTISDVLSRFLSLFIHDQISHISENGWKACLDLHKQRGWLLYAEIVTQRYFTLLVFIMRQLWLLCLQSWTWLLLDEMLTEVTRGFT